LLQDFKPGIFLLRQSKVMILVSHEHRVSWSYFFLFPNEPFFASMKQKREIFLLRRSKVMVLAKMNMCHAEKPEAGWLGGFEHPEDYQQAPFIKLV
jgi:hypothetical protein